MFPCWAVVAVVVVVVRPQQIQARPNVLNWTAPAELNLAVLSVGLGAVLTFPDPSLPFHVPLSPVFWAEQPIIAGHD